MKPHRPTSHFAFACTALVVLTPVASIGAQQRTGGIELPPVSVTATRLDSTGGGIAAVQATTVLDAQELRNKGVTTVADAMRLVPGASVVQTASRGSEVGLFMRGGERDFLLILVDGVPVNEPGGYVNLAFLSLDNVERIEVVRGPGSVLYGSDAITGVVQIFTKRSSDGRHGELAASFGSHRTRSTELSFSSTGRSSSYSLGMGRYRGDGVHDLNNGFKNNSYSGAFETALSPTSTARISGRLTDGNYRYPTAFYGEPVDSNSYNSERRLTVGSGITTRHSDRVESVLDGHYTAQRSVLADPEDGQTSFPFDIRTRMERKGGSARLNLRANSSTVFTAGADYELQSSATDGGESPATNPLLTRWNRAAFGQLLAHSTQNVDLQLGVRLDQNEHFGDFFTWRAAAGVGLGKATRLRGVLGTGFRAPQFLEITGGGFAKPNAELLPEESRSSELGIEQLLLDATVRVSATWFTQSFSNLVQYASIQGDPDFFSQHQNIDRAESDGWEFEVIIGPHPKLKLASSFTVLDARVAGDSPNAGTHLLRRPSRFGSSSVTWDASERLSLNSELVYVGRRSDTRFFADFSSESVRMGGYGRLDVAATYTLPPSASSDFPLAFTLRVENALDRTYEAVAGFQTPGRRYTLGARMPMSY